MDIVGAFLTVIIGVTSMVLLIRWSDKQEQKRFAMRLDIVLNEVERRFFADKENNNE